MNIIFLGLPGSGKGTQSTMLRDNFGMNLVSTGDMFRNIANNHDEKSDYVRDILDQGKLIDDDFVMRCVEEEVKKLFTKTNNIVFDGVPRTLNQAVALDKMLSKFNQCINFVVHFLIDDEDLLNRLNARLLCIKCGSVFSEHVRDLRANDTCPNCLAGKVSKRSDDQREIAELRLESERERIIELLAYYDERLEIHYIQANDDPQTINSKIMAKLNKIVC